jgi:TRAP-type uncharacterized transport system fused permease subunit
MSGYFRRPANVIERVLMGAGGLLLMYANTQSDLAGLGLLAVGGVMHLVRTRK